MYVCKKCNSIARRKPYLNSIQNKDIYGYGRNSNRSDIHKLVDELVELGVKHRDGQNRQWRSEDVIEYKEIKFEICAACEPEHINDSNNYPGLNGSVIDPGFYIKKFKMVRRPIYLTDIIDIKNVKLFGTGVLRDDPHTYNKELTIDDLRHICEIIPTLNYLDYDMLKRELMRCNAGGYYVNYSQFQDSTGFWYPVEIKDFLDYVRYHKKGLTINSNINFKSSNGYWSSYFLENENVENNNDYIINLFISQSILNDNDVKNDTIEEENTDDNLF